MFTGIRTYSQDKSLVETRRCELVRFASRVFIEKGYASAGMREIARSFGKSTGTIYHYVGSKEDILHLILEFVITNQQEYLNEIQATIAGLNPTAALTEAIRIYTIKYDEFADMHIFVNHVMVILNPEDRKMMLDASRRLIEFFLALINRGTEKGDFGATNSLMVAWNIVIIAGGWVNRRWFWKNAFSLDQYIGNQTELILKMLEAPVIQGS
ncbi:MAG: TetR/AcrR family transcriptional regulator [Dehalococcoidales bacterium]|nr:TetR/AcrR family transcriptional regulator [Dehalococcoidales bacterium]